MLCRILEKFLVVCRGCKGDERLQERAPVAALLHVMSGGGGPDRTGAI